MRASFFIGPFKVDPSRLLVEGPRGVHRLEWRLMRLLLCLSEQHGEVANRHELLREVWQGRLVSEASLTNSISELRQVFNDSAARQQVIETIPKVGYRLRLEVRDAPPGSGSSWSSRTARGYHWGSVLTFERIAVVGATGPTGFHLANELAGRGRRVRVVSRRRERLEELFGGRERVEIETADALESTAVERAIDGCDLVVDCIGLPADRMADHPATARCLAAAASSAGARCLQISSYWAFFPHRGEVVDESHPRTGGHEWFRLRREAEDVLLDAGAAVVHLPDFFGPRVHTSSVQLALTEAVEGKPIHWMGSGHIEREVAYVPDAVRIVADLSEREEAYGSHWALPGSGPLSGNRLAKIASEHLGRTVELWPAPAWQLRLLALVVPPLRAIRPLIPHYTRPVRYDTTRLESLLGEVKTTPLEEAIRATLQWMTGVG